MLYSNFTAHALDTVAQKFQDMARVIRFKNQVKQFTPRSDDIFIVTYPRSGTTIMQMILHQLLNDGNMDFHHITDISPWFERSLANNFLTVPDLDKLPSPRVFKSHLSCELIPPGGRYIYVERNPYDVAHSYYNLYCTHLGFHDSFEKFFMLFTKGHIQYGSWKNHVNSWSQKQHADTILYLHFEDLISDRKNIIKQIATFVNITDPQKIDHAYNRSSIQFMKKYEDKFDHHTALMRERGYKLGSFIREGKIGTGQNNITQHMQYEFEHSQTTIKKRNKNSFSHVAKFLK